MEYFVFVFLRARRDARWVQRLGQRGWLRLQPRGGEGTGRRDPPRSVWGEQLVICQATNLGFFAG